MQHCLADYQNKKRKMISYLKEKNKVYLLTKNLQTKKLSKKLNHKKIRLFYIKVTKEEVSYELHLSADVRIHSVFHVSLLKSVNSSTSIQKNFYYQTQKKNEFKVEKILEKKDQCYLVK